MKKMLTLAMLFVLATSAMAQFKYSGTIRVRGNVNNIATNPVYNENSFNWMNPGKQPTTSKVAVWYGHTKLGTTDYDYFYLTPGQYDTLYAKEYKTTEKFLDIRFRPTLEYKVSDNLNTVWTAEIGDIDFGGSRVVRDTYDKDVEVKGGLQGADGINVETKNLYFDWTFFTGHKLRAGIQNYMDPMVLIVEDDFAGVTYDADWSQYLYGLNTKIGWLKGKDDGTKNYLKTDYDYGYSNYIADASYSIDANNKAGVNFLFQNLTQDITSWVGTGTLFNNSSGSPTPVVNMNQNNTWIAPYFKGRPLYNLSVEAEFVVNMRTAEYEIVNGKLVDSLNIGSLMAPRWKYSKKDNFLPQPADQFGMAFMSKINYKITPDWEVGFNLLYASGEKLTTDKDSAFFIGALPYGITNGSTEDPRGKFYKQLTKAPTNYYKGASSFSIISKKTTTGLEILGTSGICDSRGISPDALGEYFGTIMPVLTSSYKITKDHSVGIATGFALTAEEINYRTVKNNGGEKIPGPTFATNPNDYTWSEDITSNKDNFMGFEFDVNANLNFDKMNIRPVAAFYFPGDMFQILEPGTNSPNKRQNTITAPMKMEFGLKAEFKF